MDFWFWRFGFAEEAMRERERVKESFKKKKILAFVDDNDIDLLYGIDKNPK